MDNQLWDLFRETGDPWVYLLCKAGEQREAQEKKQEKRPSETQPGIPPASL